MKFEEMNPHLKALVDLAVDSNMMCYDVYAKSGEFSQRLIIEAVNCLTIIGGNKLDAIIHDDSGVIGMYLDTLKINTVSGKSKIALFISHSHAVLGAY